MEVGYISYKLKSAHLLTLILSYYGPFEKVRSLLKILSRKGTQFLINNNDHLRYFCKSNLIDNLCLKINRNCENYLSSEVNEIKQLIIAPVHDLESKMKILSEVSKIQKIEILESDYQKEKERKQTFNQFNPFAQYLAQAQVPKFNLNERGFLTNLSGYLISSQKLMNVRSLKVDFTLSSSPEILDIIKCFPSLKELKLCMSEGQNTLVQDQVKTFQPCSGLQRTSPILYQFPLKDLQYLDLETFKFSFDKSNFKFEFVQFVQAFKNLRNLGINMPTDDFSQINEEFWRQFQKLNTLSLKVQCFDFENLKFLPQLKNLSVKVQEQQSAIPEQYMRNLAKIKIYIREPNHLKKQLDFRELEPVKFFNTNQGILKRQNMNINCWLFLEELNFNVQESDLCDYLIQLCILRSLKKLKLIVTIFIKEITLSKEIKFMPNQSLEQLHIKYENWEKPREIQYKDYTDLFLGFVTSFDKLKYFEILDNLEFIAILDYRKLFNELFAQKPHLNYSLKRFKSGSYMFDVFLNATYIFKREAFQNLKIVTISIDIVRYQDMITVLQQNKQMHALDISSITFEDLSITQVGSFFNAIAESHCLTSLKLRYWLMYSKVKLFDFENLIVTCCNKLRELRMENLYEVIPAYQRSSYHGFQNQIDEFSQLQFWKEIQQSLVQAVGKQLPKLLVFTF